MNLSTTRVLIALAALAALFSIVTIKAISTSASAATSLAQASDDARRITPDEVRDLLKKNKAVLVDVRGVEVRCRFPSAKSASGRRNCLAIR